MTVATAGTGEVAIASFFAAGAGTAATATPTHCRRNTYKPLSPEIILTEFSTAAVALRQDEIISAFALFSETCHLRQERYVRRK